MRRRTLLAAAAGGLGAAAGIEAAAGPIGNAIGDDPSEGVPDRPARPARPDDLTRESAVAYVADYEAARARGEYASAGAVETDLTAAAAFDYEVDGGYHVTARHAGTVRYEGGGGRIVSDVRSTPAPYRVTDDETVRAEVDSKRVSEPYGDGDADAVEVPLGVRIPNFADEDRVVALAVRADAGDGEVVHETTVTVGSGRAVEVRGIAVAPGVYRVVVDLLQEGVSAQGRIDVELPGVDRPADADVALLPDGVTSRPLPDADPLRPP